MCVSVAPFAAMPDTPPTTPDLNVRVVLIHHGVDARVQAATPTVDHMVEALSEFGTVHVREIWRQPPIVPVPVRALAARRLRQWWLERRWSTYLGVSRRWVLSCGLLGLRLLQLLSPGHRVRAGRQAAIELALTAKHALAWRTAVEDRIDLLVVLEDDARWRSDSQERIRDLVRIALAEGERGDTFVDLAGGVPLKTLRLGAVRDLRNDGVAVLSRASTNTTCGYALGAGLVEQLASLTASDPSAALLPADWLINHCFMALAEQDPPEPVLCLHSEPHALDHGSFTGSVASSIRT